MIGKYKDLLLDSQLLDFERLDDFGNKEVANFLFAPATINWTDLIGCRNFLYCFRIFCGIKLKMIYALHILSRKRNENADKLHRTNSNYLL